MAKQKTPRTYQITGRLSDPSGEPLAKLTVRAYDQDPSSGENFLGETLSDTQGRYALTYRDEDFRIGGREPGGADIIVRVFNAEEVKVAETEPLRNARLKAIIDVVVAPAQPRLNPRQLKRLRLLGTVVAKPAVRKKLDTAFAELSGDFAGVLARLKADRDFDEATLNVLEFTHQLGELSQDHEPLVRAFQQNTKTNSLRDIAWQFNRKALREQVRKVGIPEDVEGKDEEEKIKRYADQLNDRLFLAEVTPYIHRMVRDSELPIADLNLRAGVLRFFDNQKDFNLRNTSVYLAFEEPDAFKDIPDEHQDGVRQQMKTLQMAAPLSPNDRVLNKLIKLGLTSAHRINAIPAEAFVKQYGKAIGGPDLAQMVHHQAQVISARNEQAFFALRDWAHSPAPYLIGGGLSIDDRRNMMANATYASIQRPADGDTTDTSFVAIQPKIPINWERLFGSADYCECGHCNSVYSPAAYFVELLQYLQNNNLDEDNPNTGVDGFAAMLNTPLGKLYNRRPDLLDLDLTCENANTVLPYIDLANEVMESYVVFLRRNNDLSPTYKEIIAYNVEDETAAELLSEPQNTNDSAYRILKNEVYPAANLPYHQPIDSIRLYLNYLETSRYELVNTFTAEVKPDVPENATDAEREQATKLALFHNQAIHRAIQAEFLNLTREEFVILTKEGFFDKAGFKYTPQGPISDAQYHDAIGAKDLHEYYGYPTESAMYADVKLVKPAGIGQKGFLRSTGITYLELVDLLKTQFVNPNYPSGDALAILNRINRSYRYLQTLVDYSSSDPRTKYQKVIEAVSSSLPIKWKGSGRLYKKRRFAKADIACWVYRYFDRVGKIIVLENVVPGRCLEGVLRGTVRSASRGRVIEFTAHITSDWALLMNNRHIGNIDLMDGRIHFNHDFFPPAADAKLDGSFRGENGKTGKIVKWKIVDSNGETLICKFDADSCDLSKAQFKHLDGSELRTCEYDAMHRFIRLWRKMGWTMDELDRALSSGNERSPYSTGSTSPAGGTVGPGGIPRVGTQLTGRTLDDDPLMAEIGGFVQEDFNDDDPEIPGIGDRETCRRLAPDSCNHILTPATITQLGSIKKLMALTGLELTKLLCFWNDISTIGEKSLYRRMFLTHNLLGIDDVFKEDRNGTYLSGKTAIKEHYPVLMAAFRINAEEIETILEIAGLWPTDPLTLPNVSELYRHALLAKTLGIRIEYLATTLNLIRKQAQPFFNPEQTLEFFHIYQRMEEAGTKPQELAYVINGVDDPNRPFQPSQRVLLNHATNLRTALLQIEADHPDIKLDEEATEELLRNKLGLLFDADMTEKIVRLLNGTTVYDDITKRKFTINNDDLNTELSKIKKKEVSGTPSADAALAYRVRYNTSGGLSFTGILNPIDQAKVLGWSIDPNAQLALRKMFSLATLFFDAVLLPIFASDPITARDTLTAPDVMDYTTGTFTSATGKQAYFARHFMPYLREQLRQRMVIQSMASAIQVDEGIAQALVMDIIQEAGQPVYQELVKLSQQAVDATDPTRWTGFFAPTQDIEHCFLVESLYPVSIKFNHQELWSAPTFVDDEGIQYYQSRTFKLKAGLVYPLEIQGYYGGVANDEKIDFFWRLGEKPQEKIPESALFPKLNTEIFQKVFLALQKAALVINGLDLNLEELQFLHEHRSEFDNLDFNALTLAQWLRLEAYVRLRGRLPQTQLSLLDFLQWTNDPENALKIITFPAVSNEDTLGHHLAKLLNRRVTEISKMIRRDGFGINSVQLFRNEQNIHKLLDAFAVSDKIGIDLEQLFVWATVTSKFNETRKIAKDIRNAIRARYSQEEWEQAIKPVHDQLRLHQRDALIAHLLVQPELLNWGVANANSLYEYLLIDVQMEPCMETSRIVQATAAVQLFVQRCFLGLEAQYGVPAGALDLDRWEWMKNYRVWEANRKVFLYPENWIEPELRDNKSPFFKELESELLQNDISQENVENALKSYLYKVDEVANLEVVGLYVDGDDTPNERRQTGIIHVFARTRNLPHFYYYRNYNAKNQTWSSWEKVEVDISSYDVENESGLITGNGCYLIPVVWNGRLLIFFPQFTQKTKAREESGKTIKEIGDESPKKPINYWEIKMAWSEYRNGKWTQKQLSRPLYCTHDTGDVTVDKFSFVPTLEDYRVVIDVYHRYFESIESLGRAFMFNGSRILTAAPLTLYNWTSLPDYFHTRNKRISSLQVERGNIAELINSFPYFENYGSEIYFSLNPSSVNIKFYHPTSKYLLGLISFKGINEIFNNIKFFNEVPVLKDIYGLGKNLKYYESSLPYSLYNWEFLFHSITLIADRLSKSQRFEEAMQWWHYIFDPISSQGNIYAVWKFLPFRETNPKNVLDGILNSLLPNTANDNITEWRENPFQPHVIARNRPAAYMFFVVRKYIENLINWADACFRLFTREKVNEAIQIYILADHILGPRPEMMPKRGKLQPRSYLDLLDRWDAFGNAIDELTLVFPFSQQISAPVRFDGRNHHGNIYGFGTALYFCIPNNPKLLELWDTVADRLYKIRHCQNIEGIFQKLSLFDPEIDPALLVRAAAQGLSLSSVLNDLNTPMPNYRFNYVLGKALELTNEVKSMGNSLLSALEKKDNEAIGLLRARHDTRIQDLVMEIKKQQLEESEKALEALHTNREMPLYKLEFYQKVSGNDVDLPGIGTDFKKLEDEIPGVVEESGLKLIPFEKEDMEKASKAQDKQKDIGIVEMLASIMHIIPSFRVAAEPLGVGIAFEFGGPMLGNATQAIARGLQLKVGELSFESTRASKKSGFLRQLQSNIHQANLAGFELMQIDRQITSQEIRIAIANQEINNQQTQIDHTREVEDFLKNKYSNEQLYTWMIGQYQNLYYQVYTLAYDLAKKAEKLYRFEKGVDSNFIQFGYFDAANKGLLAGERLYLALKQLETAYVETRGHDYEITKHISLQQLNPLALIQLKEMGVCEFEVPEALFDLDFPGHYKRRIKTVGITMPCIVGPYTSLNCTVSLKKHEYRNSAICTDAKDYPKKLEESDERFVSNLVPITAIALSQGQNDSGVFELSFNSERYLPFEGAGAISTWRLEMPQEFRQFDYDTISDVVLHLRYTAVEGGAKLKDNASAALKNYVKSAAELSKTEGLFRMFSLQHEFSNAWYQMLQEPVATDGIRRLDLGALYDRLPFYAKTKGYEPTAVSIMLFTSATISEVKLNTTNLDPGAKLGALNQLLSGDVEIKLQDNWTLSFKGGVPEDGWLVLKYTMK